jgi:hypothetical protein
MHPVIDALHAESAQFPLVIRAVKLAVSLAVLSRADSEVRLISEESRDEQKQVATRPAQMAYRRRFTMPMQYPATSKLSKAERSRCATSQTFRYQPVADLRMTARAEPR